MRETKNETAENSPFQIILEVYYLLKRFEMTNAELLRDSDSNRESVEDAVTGEC